MSKPWPCSGHPKGHIRTWGWPRMLQHLIHNPIPGQTLSPGFSQHTPLKKQIFKDIQGTNSSNATAY